MVDLLVTYMELTAPPFDSVPQPALAGIEVRREQLGVADYLALYRAVGGPLQWDQRLRMAASDLLNVLQSPSTALYVLRLDGAAAGLCEFVDIFSPDVELVHFGLIPQAQGKGLGPYLLNVGLSHIWSHRPQRIWLHTDTNDHPKAEAVYRRAGFRMYDRRVETFPD